ncbi:MAG: aspartate ammonia-lyase [Myxococcota bacterium]
MSTAEEIILKLPALQQLDTATAREIAGLFSAHKFDAGEAIHRQGTPRTRLVVIEEGAVEVTRLSGREHAVPLITYGSGDGLGEGVLLGEEPHSTTATARTPVRALVADGAALRAVLDRHAEAKAVVYRGLIDRLTERLNRLSARSPDVLGLVPGNTRTETDLIGEKEVSADAYYGIQAARALDNFRITGITVSMYPDFITAFAMVKHAAARANRDCGVLDAAICDGITAACDELMQGKLREQFAVDMIQGGAGTSTNMNANEVIANRALELMGHARGEYAHCSPNDHVNKSQSTNDSYPTALKLAILIGNRRLVEELTALVAAFRAKGAEFADVLKMGRTHLQDAVPMTLGQEFDAFATSIEGEIDALEAGARTLYPVNMGGTAVGTELNAPPGYSEKCIAALAELSGFPLVKAPDLVDATSNTQGFVLYSSTLRSLAVKLTKICNDLRLLASGPRAGLGEIRLPERQPGSSIMPGKVNPVIAEVVNQVGFRIMGNDLSVTLAAQAGQLQLNVFEPVIALGVLESVRMMINASATLRVNLLEDVQANAEVCREYVDRSIGVVTALVPELGYKPASNLAREALETGRGVVELLREKQLLSEERIAEILSPERMARPLRHE